MELIKELRILQRIPVKGNTGVGYLNNYTSTFVPADVLSAYQNSNGKTFLRKIELADLRLYVKNNGTSPATYITIYGWSHNVGFDVSGVYIPFLQAIQVHLPRKAWVNLRTYDNTPLVGIDLMNQPNLDLGQNVDLTGLMTQTAQLVITPWDHRYFTTMQWEPSTLFGSLQCYATLQYTLESYQEEKKFFVFNNIRDI